MNRHRHEPSVEQLLVAPELASLAVLEAAIDMAIVAIIAVYPEMQDQDPADQTVSLRAATVVIEDGRTLAATMARYRRVLRRVHDRADDTPF
jgi:hypothetical protein